jgi:hypothetical protein
MLLELSQAIPLLPRGETSLSSLRDDLVFLHLLEEDVPASSPSSLHLFDRGALSPSYSTSVAAIGALPPSFCLEEMKQSPVKVGMRVSTLLRDLASLALVFRLTRLLMTSRGKRTRRLIPHFEPNDTTARPSASLPPSPHPLAHFSHSPTRPTHTHTTHNSTMASTTSTSTTGSITNTISDAVNYVRPPPPFPSLVPPTDCAAPVGHRDCSGAHLWLVQGGASLLS